MHLKTCHDILVLELVVVGTRVGTTLSRNIYRDVLKASGSSFYEPMMFLKKII